MYINCLIINSNLLHIQVLRLKAKDWQVIAKWLQYSYIYIHQYQLIRYGTTVHQRTIELYSLKQQQ